VLADITRVLADEKISIDAVIQKEPGEGEDEADLVLLTHRTREQLINESISRLEKLPVVVGKVTRLRMEALGK
jgi:homoserine dehydrogenase